MKGEKIITQPWWCQRWRNFNWIFWRLNGQMHAWNQDHFDRIWCQNVCQAKWFSFIFKFPKFNFSISRSWRILLFHFDRNCFVLILGWIAEFTAAPTTSQWDCLKFFLAKLLAKEGFWLVEKKFVFKCDRGIYSVFSAHRKCTISSLFWKTFHSCTFTLTSFPSVWYVS